MDRFTSNQNQNDYQRILYIIVVCISPAEMIRFCDICLPFATYWNVLESSYFRVNYPFC